MSQECHNPNFGRKMSFEIERKFLVLSDTWRNSVIRHTRIRQAYLDSNAKVSIRVRIKDDSSATLTLKSRSSKLRRREFKYVDLGRRGADITPTELHYRKGPTYRSLRQSELGSRRIFWRKPGFGCG